MERRDFLKRMAGAAAAAAVLAVEDPERLLWEPGRKTIFLPPEVTARTLDENVRFSRLTVDAPAPAPAITLANLEDLAIVKADAFKGGARGGKTDYMSGRYRVTTHTGEMLVFDSNWGLQAARGRDGRVLTGYEAQQAVARAIGPPRRGRR